jgi:hypothetical protein
MLPKFFRTYKHKVFHYIPIYYNQQKEELEERIKRIESDLKGEPSGDYKPSRIKGAFKNIRSERKRADRVSSVRLIIIIFILLAIAYYLFKV